VINIEISEHKSRFIGRSKAKAALPLVKSIACTSKKKDFYSINVQTPIYFTYFRPNYEYTSQTPKKFFYHYE
jgi:hypothetical protein